MIMTMKLLFRPCLRDCQLQRWICLQCWKLPLHRVHVQVKKKIQNTKYLSIECMHRSRKCNKFKITNERAMEMIYLVRKN